MTELINYQDQSLRRRDRSAPVLWLTGLSGAGKSTIARGLVQELSSHEICVELLDGDEIRSELSGDLGFSRADRDLQVHRLGFLAQLLSRNGILVIVSAISPYRETRAQALERLERPFEIHVDAPLDVVEARDTKGLYARARAGLITAMTGVDDPYEAPEAPALRLDSANTTPQQCVGSLLDLLRRERYLHALAS